MSEKLLFLLTAAFSPFKDLFLLFLIRYVFVGMCVRVYVNIVSSTEDKGSRLFWSWCYRWLGPNMGTGIGTRVTCKSTKHYSPLSHLSSPTLMIFYVGTLERSVTWVTPPPHTHTKSPFSCLTMSYHCLQLHLTLNFLSHLCDP